MVWLSKAALAALCVVVPAANAFAPAASIVRPAGLRSAAVSARPARNFGPKMTLDSSIVDGAQALISAVENIPFTDELTGEAQGFTAPLNHFASVRCPTHTVQIC